MAEQDLSRRQAISLLAQSALGALALSGCASMGGKSAGASPPNIIYIMSDDHAVHALSCYGSKINQTPNLDRLASQGMRFERVYVTNAICGPSRATLLTGKYSHKNGYRDNTERVRFDGSQQTFPKLLRQAGYQTAVVGKWHLSSDPTGFDYWCIMPGQGRYRNPQFIEMGQRQTVNGYVTDVITDKAIAYLEKRDTSKPFCLLYHHKAPHREWTPDEKHATLYDDREIPLPETFNDDWSGRGRAAREQDMTIAKTLNRTDLKQDPPAGLTGQALKEWKYQRYIKDYLRTVASLDENIGRMLDYLDKSGLAANTIVIYTADNGFFLGDHGWFDKRFMYEHSSRIPLIVRWPGVVKAGSVNRDFVCNTDFAPTFVDCAGLAVPGDMQGRSIRPLLRGRTPGDWRKSFYYRYYEFPQPHHVHPHYGVRTDRYKLIYYNTLNEWELFDLEKDPNELKSVYDDPAYAQVRKDMEAELKRVKAEAGDTEA